MTEALLNEVQEGVGVTADAPQEEAASSMVASVCFHPAFCVRSSDDAKLWSRDRHLGSDPYMAVSILLHNHKLHRPTSAYDMSRILITNLGYHDVV